MSSREQRREEKGPPQALLPAPPSPPPPQTPAPGRAPFPTRGQAAEGDASRARQRRGPRRPVQRKGMSCSAGEAAAPEAV